MNPACAHPHMCKAATTRQQIAAESGQPEWVFDDGRTFALTGIAGGAAPGGIFSTVMCEYKDSNGEVTVMHYKLESRSCIKEIKK